MVKRKKKKDAGGTLIRGADGRLYFISNSKLKKYGKRISPKDQRKIPRAQAKGLAKALKAIKVKSSEVASIFGLMPARRRREH